MHAIASPVGSETVAGRPGWTTTVYVGLPHPQATRLIEVIAATRPPRDMVIFHVMELSDIYAHLSVKQEGEQPVKQEEEQSDERT